MLFKQLKSAPWPTRVVHVGPITAGSFCRSESPMKTRFEQLLSKCGGVKDQLVVLSLGEIDIRAHFWRDAPLMMSRDMPLADFVAHRAQALIDGIDKFIEGSGAASVVIWGPPVSLFDEAPHNDEFPTAGNNKTRNILTHLYHQALLERLHTENPKIGLASMFYDMLLNDFCSDPNFITDTIHLNDDLLPKCMTRLQEAVTGNGIALGNHVASLASRAVDLVRTPAPKMPNDSDYGEFYKQWFVCNEPQRKAGAINLGDLWFDFCGIGETSEESGSEVLSLEFSQVQRSKRAVRWG